MCPAVPTITLFIAVDLFECAEILPPHWMLLEERIAGQIAETISRRRFRLRSIARRRADRARQEWACQLQGNRRQRESLPSEWLSGPDLLIWIPRENPSDERRASQSRNHGRKLCESLWLPAPKRQHHRRRLFLRVAPASRHGVWERRRCQLPSWSSGPCSSG